MRDKYQVTLSAREWDRVLAALKRDALRSGQFSTFHAFSRIEGQLEKLGHKKYA